MIFLCPIICALTITAIALVPSTKAASCGSNEYCPAGWSVKRNPEDYSARTCHTAAREGDPEKCPKPYMCVASRCGINFCCISDKMLAKLQQREEEVKETAENDREDREEEELYKRGNNHEGVGDVYADSTITSPSNSASSSPEPTNQSISHMGQEKNEMTEIKASHAITEEL